MIEWLFERFREAGRRPAIVWRGRSQTYAWLSECVAAARALLDANGIAPGTVVALEGDYSPELCAMLLALVERRAILVPLSSAVEAAKPRFHAIAEVQAIVRYAASGDGPASFERREGRPSNPLTCGLAAAGTPGLVLFSSGSTGEPKAALHDLARLLTKFETRRHSLVTLAFLLLDHIGGINTLFYILSNTGVVVTPEGRSPDDIGAAIERHRVELLPTTPTFLNLLLLSEAWTRHDLSSLKQITYGTEPMPPTTLARVHALFPKVKLLQTYGLSELGILRSQSKGPDSLWVKVGGEGFETKVVDGLLWIRAQSAMLGYLNAPSPFDAEGWFNTGDEVEVDGAYLRILGRRSELVNVGGQKVYPVEVENVLLEMPNVLDVTVRGEPNPITGQMIVAAFRLETAEDLASLRGRVRSFCRERLAAFQVPTKVEIAAADLYSGRFKKTRHPASAGTGGS
jgi:long-chain acyl-CoA synthetase